MNNPLDDSILMLTVATQCRKMNDRRTRRSRELILLGLCGHVPYHLTRHAHLISPTTPHPIQHASSHSAGPASSTPSLPPRGCEMSATPRLRYGPPVAAPNAFCYLPLPTCFSLPSIFIFHRLVDALCPTCAGNTAVHQHDHGNEPYIRPSTGDGSGECPGRADAQGR